VRVDEAAVVNRRRKLEVLPDRPRHHRFDRDRRDAAHRSRLFGLSLQEGGGQIVAVLDAVLSDMARRHPVAAIVEDAAH